MKMQFSFRFPLLLLFIKPLLLYYKNISVSGRYARSSTALRAPHARKGEDFQLSHHPLMSPNKRQMVDDEKKDSLDGPKKGRTGFFVTAYKGRFWAFVHKVAVVCVL